MSRVVLAACAALFACVAMAPSAARADERALRSAFGHCGDPCVITYNPGGEVRLFQAAARAVRNGARRQVVIDGPCISACAIFADMARSRVCITRRAQFGFHKASLWAEDPRRGGAMRLMGREDPPHSRDIAQWVRNRGGFPTRGFRTMSNAQASQFWRRCAATTRS